MKIKTKTFFLVMSLLIFSFGFSQELISTPTSVPVTAPFEITYNVSGNLQKRVILNVAAIDRYANVGLMAGSDLLIDNIDVPSNRANTLDFIVEFTSLGNTTLKLFAINSDITVNNFTIQDNVDVLIPKYIEVTDAVGFTYPAGLKYNGPTIADLDNDGDYDFILNNHNDDPRSPSVIFNNNGDGTLTQGTKLSQFILQDLHGSGAGDYDNDGDLDILLTLGGGNGTNPVPPVFLRNDDGNYVRSDVDVGITDGSRGRGARWADFDQDGDLDLALFNAPLSDNTGPQHFFYANRGDGTFNTINVPGLEKATSDRVLVTDINKDHIEDIVMLNPLSIWKGRGDFSFENVTADWLPASLRNKLNSLAATDIDIDNDGDLDLYISQGLEIFLTANRSSVDFNPETETLDGRTSGFKGSLPIAFKAPGDLKLFDIESGRANNFLGDYPVFIGSAKKKLIDNINVVLDRRKPLEPQLVPEMTITQDMANGFPTDRSENGIYIGYVGNNQWQFETVRDGNLFFSITFSIEGISEITSDNANFSNRNVQDILLRNDLDSDGNVNLVDVSEEWNIPKGGSHWGVTRGDFNNDGFQDLFVNRYGFVRNRRTDYMALNTGKGSFEITTTHGAKNTGSSSHGDMGQAFDFDLDGDVDILGSDDENGVWHLYRNERNDDNNYAIVRVGYSPISNIDTNGAEVTVTTPNNSYFQRVGSAGESYSQSLLNMIHFGLGLESTITNIKVRWRNGETAEFNNENANQIFDTDLLDPTSLAIDPSPIDVRVGTTLPTSLGVEPIFANREVVWSSADPTIATVDQNGVVEGIKEGASTTITATSVGDNSVIATAIVNVIPFFSIPAESVTLSEETLGLVEGNTATVSASVSPNIADDTDVTWSSSDESVATVDQNGFVTAISEGSAVITASSKSDSSIQDTLDVTVQKLIAPSISLVPNRENYLNTIYGNEGTIEVSVAYHAGTGNQVIRGSNNGMRFFLRHIGKGFSTIIRDIVVKDESIIGTESGVSTVSINLDERPDKPLLTPTADLPGGGMSAADGEFYFLFVSFSTSSGENLNTSASPIQIIEGKVLSVNDFDSFNVKDLQLFPNPTQDMIFFLGLNNKNYDIIVRNLLGQVISKSKITKNTQGVDVSNLSTGQYIVTISQGSDSKSINFVKK